MPSDSAAARSPRAFFVKCRPCDADIIELAKNHCRVFVGYAPWIVNYPTELPRSWRECLLDISDPDEKRTVIAPLQEPAYQRGVSGNRGFAQSIEKGDIVAVPRPAEGRCYVGRVTSRFELVDHPVWADEYLSLRGRLAKEGKLGESANELSRSTYESEHVSDVVQTWAVEALRSVAFPLVPRWISYRLLSRTTIGWIPDAPDGRMAWTVLNELYDGRYTPDLRPTSDLDMIECRLLDWVSPSMFEHLVCELLQREQEGNRWFHVGGTGDGGADGMALDTRGNLVGILQCKWKYSADLRTLADEVLNHLGQDVNKTVAIYVANLYDTVRVAHADERIRFLDRREISRLLLRHADRCALAATLGIKSMNEV